MTVSTVNRCKIMPACFLRQKISTEMLECRLRVHVNVNHNIQTEHEKSLGFSKGRHLFKREDHFKQNFTNLLSAFRFKGERIRQQCMCKKVGGVRSIVKIYRKNEIQRRYSITFLFSCKLSYNNTIILSIW